MTAFPFLPFPIVLLVGASLLASCTSPGYNDNPSQQVTTGRVGCLAATEFFALYFNVHVQPAADGATPKILKEVFRSYCDNLPMPGRVFFTADLVGPELKRMPIAIRVVEQEPAGIGGNLKGAYREVRTVATFPDTLYSKGVIELQFDLDKAGNYAVQLDRGGAAAVTDFDKLRIPLHVGTLPGTEPWLSRTTVLTVVALTLALTAGLAFRRFPKRGVG